MIPLYHKHPYRTRWTSFENPSGTKGHGGRENQGAKGHAFDSLAPGETKVLLDVAGAGLVHRIWLTLRQRTPQVLRALRLEMFWDGAETPAVAVPLGDFFCAGLALVPFENELFASPEGRSFIATVPMPFRTAARITLTNETDQEIPYLFYDINYSLADTRDEHALFFHAHWRRENPTTLSRDFTVLPRVTGSGRFLGAFFSVITNPLYENTWWGEGEVKVYLDGDDTYPSLVGT
ncbi:MAG TPA: glycoside hydrolase family 172 protein, partial [Anaerolineae bacterium]